MKFKNVIILFFVTSFPFLGYSQKKPLVIDLEGILNRMGVDNVNIKALKYKSDLAFAKSKKAGEWWMPEIYAGISIHQLDGIAMNSDGRFFLDVDRQNFQGGGGLGVELDFGNGIFQTQASKHRANATRFDNVAKRNQLILQAIYKYFELQAAQAKLNTHQELLTQSESIARQLEAQVAGGLAYKSDLLLAKSNLNHNKIELEKTKAHVLGLSAEMAGLLNEKEGLLVIADSILAPVELVKQETISPSNFQNRPEWKSHEQSLAALQKSRKTLGAGLLLPTLRLNAYQSVFGDIFSPTDIMNAPIDKLHSTFEFNGVLLWEVPLSSLIGKGERQEINARINLQKVQGENMQLQVFSEISALEAQLKATLQQINFATESLSLSGEALSQSIERQKIRTARPFEVFQAQEYFMQAQIDYIEAVKNYNQTQYSLYIALGNNL